MHHWILTMHLSNSLKNLEQSIVDIQLWITHNLLKLINNKTNIIYLASEHCVKSLITATLQTGASSIIPKGSVNNLEVISERFLKMY